MTDSFSYVFLWLAAVSRMAVYWLKSWLADGISAGEKVDAQRWILVFQTAQLRLFPAALVNGLGGLMLRV